MDDPYRAPEARLASEVERAEAELRRLLRDEERAPAAIRLDTPCAEPWDGMARVGGDTRRRRCARCDRDVFDVSQLTHDEATALLGVEGRLVCMRLYRRPDGTVATKDCGRGGRKRLLLLVGAGLSVAALTAAQSVPEDAPRDGLAWGQFGYSMGHGIFLWEGESAESRGEYASLVIAQAHGHLRAIDRHRGALSKLFFDEDGSRRLLQHLLAGDVDTRSNASPKLTEALRARLDIHPRPAPRDYVAAHPELADAAPDEPVVAHARIAILAQMCRDITNRVERFAPHLADDFRLDAMGE